MLPAEKSHKAHVPEAESLKTKADENNHWL